MINKNALREVNLYGDYTAISSCPISRTVSSIMATLTSLAFFLLMDENLRELDKNRDTKKIFVRFLKIFVQTKEDNYFLLRGRVIINHNGFHGLNGFSKLLIIN